MLGVAVGGLCRFWQYPEFETHQIELCVVEAVTNVVRHAYGEEPGHEVDVRMALGEKLRFEIRDRGRTMPQDCLEASRQLPEIDASHLENLSEGGRGLFLLQAIMEDVRYTSTAGGNCLSMTHLPPRRPAPSSGPVRKDRKEHNELILETYERDEICVVKLLGPRLDARVAVEFKNELLEVIQKGNKRILLDFERVEFLDSSGLGALVACLKRIGKEGDMRLSCLGPAISSLLKLTRLDRIFQIYESEAVALEQYR